MLKFCFILSVSICVNNGALFAQHVIEELDNNQDTHVSEQWTNRIDWMPSILNASNNSLYSMVLYNGRYFAWNLRGVKTGSTNIDGVNWSSALSNWRLGDLMGGMQKEVHMNRHVMNGDFSENGYTEKESVRYFTTDITTQKRMGSLNIGFSNSFFAHSFQLHFNNALSINKWHNAIGIHFQQLPPGLFPGRFIQSGGLVLATEKKISFNSKLGFSLIWNFSDQGKSASTVNEMFNLSNQQTYNPSWGWYHGQHFFPNTTQSNAPLFTIKYQKNIGEYKVLKMTNALIIGVQSQSSLEWTHAADPRPDYYRYLPSYIKDSALSTALIQWDFQHPENLQIQLDKLEQINKASKDKRSFYIVNQENQNLVMAHGAVFFSNRIFSNLNIQLGANYSLDQIHTNNTIKDLLGGQYYYNYNSWINDDGTELSFQNDITHPNRKIQAGENWGADYLMQSYQFKPWVQIEKEGKFIVSKFAIGFEFSGVNRKANNQNGISKLIDSNSTPIRHFVAWDFKEGLEYKLNGRFSIHSIMFGQLVAPSINLLFINPEIVAATSPYAIHAFNYGVDFGIKYASPTLKISTTVYWKRLVNQTVQKMFYHDGYAAFVYGLVGNMNQLFTGFESSVDLDFLTNLSLSLVSTWQQSYYENEPSYRLLNVNDLQVLTSGLLHLNNIAVSSSPKMVNVLNIHYQPFKSLSLNISLLYAQKRHIDIDYFRRSDAVKNKIDAISWTQLVQEKYLPDNSLVNFSFFKSFQFTKSNKLFNYSVGGSVRNLLNRFIPIIAYEQTRFDYLHFDSNKYAIKYMMDQGTTYNVHFQMTIQ